MKGYEGVNCDRVRDSIVLPRKVNKKGDQTGECGKDVRVHIFT